MENTQTVVDSTVEIVQECINQIRNPAQMTEEDNMTNVASKGPMRTTGWENEVERQTKVMDEAVRANALKMWQTICKLITKDSVTGNQVYQMECNMPGRAAASWSAPRTPMRNGSEISLFAQLPIEDVMPQVMPQNPLQNVPFTPSSADLL